MLSCLLAISVATLLAVSTAHAAEQPSAKEHLMSGLAHAEKGEWEQALAEFEEAHHLDPQPATLFDVAQARQKTGRYRAAIEAYRALLAAKASLPPHQVEVAQKGLALAESRIARLTVRGDASMDSISVDDQVITQWPLVLDPGAHVARGFRGGKVVDEKRVTLSAGTTVDVDLVTRKEPPPPLAVRKEEEKKTTNVVPWIVLGSSALVLGAGAFFSAHGYSSWTDLNDGCGRSKTCSEDDVSSARRDLAIGDVAIGVGLVGVAVGVALLVFGNSSNPTRASVDKLYLLR